jgi:hypothetical protein
METTPIVIADVVSGIPIKLPNRRTDATKILNWPKANPNLRLTKTLWSAVFPQNYQIHATKILK